MKSLIGTFILLIISSLVVLAVFNDRDFFTINLIDIQIKGIGTDTSAWLDLNKEIKRELEIYMGKSLWKISLEEVKQKIFKFKLIKNVEVSKSFPNLLNVSYTLPQLKVIENNKEGHYKIMTEEGKWLGPMSWARLPSLPWLSGNWLQKKPFLVQKLLSLLNALPEKSSLSETEISEIGYNELDGFLLTLKQSGQQILFGFDNFEIKALRVIQVLDYLQSRDLESRVIDANFSKKVLVRLRNHP